LVDAAALVRTAAERFVEGADAPFISCFHEGVTAHREPAVDARPVISSRDELAVWVERARKAQPGLQVTVNDVEPIGAGAVCEAIVVGRDPAPDVWRVALAARVKNDLIYEVRAFWAREAAERWLLIFG
jgi:hypothetical protein